MEKNELIETWKFGASLTLLVEHKTPLELATRQLKMLNDEMQKQGKSLEDLPPKHREFIDYLQKLIETGEFNNDQERTIRN